MRKGDGGAGEQVAAKRRRQRRISSGTGAVFRAVSRCCYNSLRYSHAVPPPCTLCFTGRLPLIPNSSPMRCRACQQTNTGSSSQCSLCAVVQYFLHVSHIDTINCEDSLPHTEAYKTGRWQGIPFAQNLGAVVRLVGSILQGAPPAHTHSERTVFDLRIALAADVHADTLMRGVV